MLPVHRVINYVMGYAVPAQQAQFWVRIANVTSPAEIQTTTVQVEVVAGENA
jgi:CO dehydrogenase/acetyl-CoA synthase beta subunit